MGVLFIFGIFYSSLHKLARKARKKIEKRQKNFRWSFLGQFFFKLKNPWNSHDRQTFMNKFVHFQNKQKSIAGNEV